MKTLYRIPAAYAAGRDRALRHDPALAEAYLAHTVLGDPPADLAVEALAGLGREEAERYIRAGIEGDIGTLAPAPRPLRYFFGGIAPGPPGWFDPDLAAAARRAFHGHTDAFVTAFFVVTLRNQATSIGKSFHATGRVASGQRSRRIRQNTRHFIEIMRPGSLEDRGDGWKLSVRIRLVHAQVRRLIRRSGKWDESVYGAPLSAAHMGLASANFSATMLSEAARLGARLDTSTRRGFMLIWRYASLLAGTPEALLFEGDEARTADLCRIARICEPPPGEESRLVATTLFEALPDIAGKTGPAERRDMIERAQRVSRALLGRELADGIGIPWRPTFGLLASMRARRQALAALRLVAPGAAARRREENLDFLLRASALDGIGYRLPDALKADEASPW